MNEYEDAQHIIGDAIARMFRKYYCPYSQADMDICVQSILCDPQIAVLAKSRFIVNNLRDVCAKKRIGKAMIADGLRRIVEKPE